jgi:4-amino-4-deoxy-L-arabinose transferase-like glycosyltransferase
VERFVSRTTLVGVSIALCVFVIALRAPLFDLPLERDEGEYAYIAWRLTAGETPYLDWFDQKPPGVFLAYRLALALPGDPIVAIRAVAALFGAGSALALFGLARALFGAVAGVVAALLLAFLSADPMLQGPIANTEIFMVPGIVAAAFLTLRTLGSARPPFATAVTIGLALGIATAFKQVALVNAPFFLAVYAWRAPSGARGSATARFAAAMAAGGLLVWAPILLWLWQRGALTPAIDAILLHNLAYSAALTLPQRASQLLYMSSPLVATQGVAWLLAAVGLIALARRAERLPAVFLGGFALVNAIGVSVSGFYFPHYFQQLLPAVAALAAAAVTAGSEATARRRALSWVGVALALTPLVIGAVGFWRIDSGEASRRIYPSNYFDVMPAIAAEVAAQTSPDDRIFVFGSEPEILFHARRVSASRYIFLFPLFGEFGDAEQRQAGVVAELEAARPAAIVWIPTRFGPESPQILAQYTASLINSAYRLRAYAVADAEGRGQLRLIDARSDPREALAEQNPWAMLFVRAQ